RHAEAAKLFRQALTEEPHNFTALVGLGTTLAETQEYGEAAPYLEKAWSSRAGDFQSGYELARTLQELKRPAEAQKVLTRLSPPQDRASAAKFYALSAGVAEQLGDQPAAIREYRRAYELSPQSFEIYLALVRSALRTQDQQWAQLPPAPSGLSGEQHLALGLIFASGGAYSIAVSHFRQTLQLEPTSYLATYNLALAYKQDGNPQAAIELLERTLEKQPSAELHNLLASLEEETGRYVEAVRHYQRAVDLEPDDEQYYFDLGAEYLMHLTLVPATEVFRVASDRGDGLDLAQSLLEKAVHLNPKLAIAHLELGTLYAHRKESQKAVASFLTAIRLDPNSEMAHYRLGQTYRDLNQLALAEWELNLYQRLSRNHQNQMAQTRSAIRQFVLAKPASQPVLTEKKAPL